MWNQFPQSLREHRHLRGCHIMAMFLQCFAAIYILANSGGFFCDCAYSQLLIMCRKANSKRTNSPSGSMVVIKNALHREFVISAKLVSKLAVNARISGSNPTIDGYSSISLKAL